MGIVAHLFLEPFGPISWEVPLDITLQIDLEKTEIESMNNPASLFGFLDFTVFQQVSDKLIWQQYMIS